MHLNVYCSQLKLDGNEEWKNERARERKIFELERKEREFSPENYIVGRVKEASVELLQSSLVSHTNRTVFTLSNHFFAFIQLISIDHNFFTRNIIKRAKDKIIREKKLKI